MAVGDGTGGVLGQPVTVPVMPKSQNLTSCSSCSSLTSLNLMLKTLKSWRM